jgi:hypothetical protein
MASVKPTGKPGWIDRLHRPYDSSLGVLPDILVAFSLS